MQLETQTLKTELSPFIGPPDITLSSTVLCLMSALRSVFSVHQCSLVISSIIFYFHINDLWNRLLRHKVPI